METNEFMTNKDAAKFLHVSEVTLWRERGNGNLPFYRIASKLLYRRSDLECYMESKKRNCDGQNEQK
ncbi:MAG: helix-turn-helix domain-containing protein [Pyrinomonadaceae bacterium]